MATRRSPQENRVSVPTSRSTYFLRKYPLRHASLSTRRAFTPPDECLSFEFSASRPVLVPLQPNLRRLPTRFMTLHKGGRGRALRNLVPAPQVNFAVGTKRKRVVSGNENVYYASARSGQLTGRFKRQRSTSSKDNSSDEVVCSGASEMEIDDKGEYGWEASDHTDAEVDGMDNCELWRPLFHVDNN